MLRLLKLLVFLVIGMACGLLLAAIMIVCLTDTSFAEFLIKLKSVEFSEILVAATVGVLAFMVSRTVVIVIHELGHLVSGLLSGYKFVSLRVFNLTFIRIDGETRVKKFTIPGTGGQCAMSPPNLPIEKIPTEWYNFGGVLFNLIALVAVIPLFFVTVSPILSECIAIFTLTDVAVIIINGFPMKLSGIGNDAYNMMLLRKDPSAKRRFIVSLRLNALMQEGVSLKDMPADWFAVPETIDYRDPLQASFSILATDRFLYELKYNEALEAREDLYRHKDEINRLYVNELESELVFLRLICGDIEGAEALLDNELRIHLIRYRRMSSSKQRVLCAIALKLENDREKATAIYEEVLKHREDYLFRGEVNNDLDIMRDILNPASQKI